MSFINERIDADIDVRFDENELKILIFGEIKILFLEAYKLYLVHGSLWYNGVIVNISLNTKLIDILQIFNKFLTEKYTGYIFDMCFANINQSASMNKEGNVVTVYINYNDDIIQYFKDEKLANKYLSILYSDLLHEFLHLEYFIFANMDDKKIKNIPYVKYTNSFNAKYNTINGSVPVNNLAHTLDIEFMQLYRMEDTEIMSHAKQIVVLLSSYGYNKQEILTFVKTGKINFKDANNYDSVMQTLYKVYNYNKDLKEFFDKKLNKHAYTDNLLQNIKIAYNNIKANIVNPYYDIIIRGIKKEIESLRKDVMGQSMLDIMFINIINSYSESEIKFIFSKNEDEIWLNDPMILRDDFIYYATKYINKLK